MFKKTETTRTLAAMESPDEVGSEGEQEGGGQEPARLPQAPTVSSQPRQAVPVVPSPVATLKLESEKPVPLTPTAPFFPGVKPAPQASMRLPVPPASEPIQTTRPAANLTVATGVRLVPLPPSRPATPSGPTAARTVLTTPSSPSSPVTSLATRVPQELGGSPAPTRQVALDPQTAPSTSAVVQQRPLPVIELRGEITPWILAKALGEKSSLVIVLALKDIGVIAKSNTVIDSEVADALCKNKGYQLKRI